MLRQTLAGTASGPGDPMVLEFDTSLGTTTIEIPLKGTVNVLVTWGDGTSNTYTTTGFKTHVYATGGVYQVTITGVLTGFGSGAISSRPELTKCLAFGELGLTDLSLAFYGCNSLSVVPTTLPPSVTAIDGIFGFCYIFNQDISGWDVSTFTDFDNVFLGANAFNQDISGWDVSSATSMFGMFSRAYAFNQDISGWDVSNVTDMGQMFNDATVFNQNIGAWNTANVEDMVFMFSDATAFNQDIGAWDTSKVTDMRYMFADAVNFNQDLTGWCVGNSGSEPLDFARNSALTAGNKPVWGTCPAYIASGSITYIGSATGTTSATLPAHQAGDLIIGFAFRDGSTTAPTRPSGWTTIDTATGILCSGALAYKVAASSSETTGTWTNAISVIFLVYRGTETNGQEVTFSKSTGDVADVTYAANGCWQTLSAMVAFAGHRSTNTALGTAPGDLTLIVNPTGGTAESAAFRSTVDNYGNWVSTNVAVGGTASGWVTFTTRVRVPIVLA